MTQHFLGALDRYEARVFHFGNNSSGGNVLRLMGVDMQYAELGARQHSVPTIRSTSTSAATIFDYHKICVHVCAFRLFEELGLESGCLTRLPNPPSLPALSLPRLSGETDKLHVCLPSFLHLFCLIHYLLGY